MKHVIIMPDLGQTSSEAKIVSWLKKPGEKLAMGEALLEVENITKTFPGVVANDRRTAWVMLVASLVTAYLLSPPRRWKRTVTRAVLILVPVIGLYATIGWNQSGGVFAPLNTFRTLSDGSIDSSTFWREVENWNLTMGIREHPILGIGLGPGRPAHRHLTSCGRPRCDLVALLESQTGPALPVRAMSVWKIGTAAQQGAFGH